MRTGNFMLTVKLSLIGTFMLLITLLLACSRVDQPSEKKAALAEYQALKEFDEGTAEALKKEIEKAHDTK